MFKWKHRGSWLSWTLERCSKNILEVKCRHWSLPSVVFFFCVIVLKDIALVFSSGMRNTYPYSWHWTANYDMEQRDREDPRTGPCYPDLPATSPAFALIVACPRETGTVGHLYYDIHDCIIWPLTILCSYLLLTFSLSSCYSSLTLLYFSVSSGIKIVTCLKMNPSPFPCLTTLKEWNRILCWRCDYLSCPPSPSSNRS